MSTGIVTQFKEAGQSTMAAHQLWSKFTDSTAPSLPSSLFDASTRVFQNLTRFFFFTCLNQQFIEPTKPAPLVTILLSPRLAEAGRNLAGVVAEVGGEGASKVTSVFWKENELNMVDAPDMQTLVVKYATRLTLVGKVC